MPNATKTQRKHAVTVLTMTVDHYLNWAEGLPKIQQRATARSRALTGGAGKFMKSYEIHS